MSDGKSEKRENYPHFLAIPTRWMDNDVYGHVNNVVYYSYFDTVINDYLMAEGGLDFSAGDVVGIAVETMCQFHKSLAFPDLVDAGLRVGKLGNSSVRYEIGLFRAGTRKPPRRVISCMCSFAGPNRSRCRCPVRSAAPWSA